MSFRQEVLNVVLAQLLRERGIISAPEDVLKYKGKRRMPDVLVDYSGLRTAIEGEVSDQPKAEEKAIKSATKRVEDGIAHIGVAIVYPEILRNKKLDALPSSLEACSLRIAVTTEAGQTGFVDGDLDYLADILRRTFDQLVREDVVNRAVAKLEGGIEQYARVVSSSPATCERIAESLGIRELSANSNQSETDHEAE
jgi:hypothetical protein